MRPDAPEMGTVRAHLEAAAKSSKKAAAELVGPAFTHELAYLHEWAKELYYRRRRSEPVTWVDLDAWARRTGRDPEPEEAHALFVLTDVMAHPPEKPKA